MHMGMISLAAFLQTQSRLGIKHSCVLKQSVKTIYGCNTEGFGHRRVVKGGIHEILNGFGFPFFP